MLTLIPSSQINGTDWDACVASSPQQIIYGYSWYLNAVLPAPDWTWMGVVLLDDAGQYQAVMPIPLRRKAIVGLTYQWVVHQPFFCQLLGVFSREGELDTAPFFQLMVEQFRYGSTVSTRQQPGDLGQNEPVSEWSTHVLDLSVGYQHIFQNYTNDRKLNLRRAKEANWIIADSTDPETLLALFRANHATEINGGVAHWAYLILRSLIKELGQRKLITLRYALQGGKIEAGVLFVQEGRRIIYLFNAASKAGRQGNARTLLLDQLIQEKAGQLLVLDFESPAKQTIRAFYQSFGANKEVFWQMSWNHLNPVERFLQTLKNRLLS